MRQEVSAGVVVVRHLGTPELLALRETRRGSDAHWVFPKGHVEPGETELQAALRELREEAGLALEAAQPLQVTTHRFEGRHGPTEKTVHWFVTAAPADLVPTPGEGFAEARWLTLEQAVSLLVHESHRALATQAVAAST